MPIRVSDRQVCVSKPGPPTATILIGQGVAIVNLVLSSVLVHACSETVPAADEQHISERNPFRIQVLRTLDCPPDPRRSLPAEHRRITVEVQIESARRQLPTNPYYARLVDDRGNLFKARLKGCSPDIRTDLLALGGLRTGGMTFDVPELARGLSLVYSPPLDQLPRYEQQVAIEIPPP